MPWRQILLSGPVWAIILTHVASIYGFFTVVNQLPTFMKKVLHFNIKQVYSACPTVNIPVSSLTCQLTMPCIDRTGSRPACRTWAST